MLWPVCHPRPPSATYIIRTPNPPVSPLDGLHSRDFGATCEEAAKGNELGPKLDLGDGYDVTSVELIGRSGHPRGGTFEIIESFPLG